MRKVVLLMLILFFGLQANKAQAQQVFEEAVYYRSPWVGWVYYDPWGGNELAKVVAGNMALVEQAVAPLRQPLHQPVYYAQVLCPACAGIVCQPQFWQGQWYFCGPVVPPPPPVVVPPPPSPPPQVVPVPARPAPVQLRPTQHPPAVKHAQTAPQKLTGLSFIVMNESKSLVVVEEGDKRAILKEGARATVASFLIKAFLVRQNHSGGYDIFELDLQGAQDPTLPGWRIREGTSTKSP